MDLIQKFNSLNDIVALVSTMPPKLRTHFQCHVIRSTSTSFGELIDSIDDMRICTTMETSSMMIDEDLRKWNPKVYKLVKETCIVHILTRGTTDGVATRLFHE